MFCLHHKMLIISRERVFFEKQLHLSKFPDTRKNRLGESLKGTDLTNRQPVMSKRKGLEGMFDGRHFDRELITLYARCYLCYKLSLCDLVEMMAERSCRRHTPRSCVG
jgi:hypothetical protein